MSHHRPAIIKELLSSLLDRNEIHGNSLCDRLARRVIRAHYENGYPCWECLTTDSCKALVQLISNGISLRALNLLTAVGMTASQNMQRLSAYVTSACQVRICYVTFHAPFHFIRPSHCPPASAVACGFPGTRSDVTPRNHPSLNLLLGDRA